MEKMRLKVSYVLSFVELYHMHCHLLISYFHSLSQLGLLKKQLPTDEYVTVAVIE